MNPADDFKFDIVQGEEMTEEDMNIVKQLFAKCIYNQVIAE